MRRRQVAVVMAGAAAVWAAALAGTGAAHAGAVSAGSGKTPAASSWGKAIELPRPGVLNAAGHADVRSVSCPSAGSCAVAGSYFYGSARHSQGFVASQRRGTWGTPVEVPGLAALDEGKDAGVSSLSCASAGNCAAAGDYLDRSGHRQGFVASQRNGRWGKAIEIPGFGALSKGVGAFVMVSCGSAGNCAAAGAYQDALGFERAFVASERNAVWGRAIKVPGMAALTAGGNFGFGGESEVDAVSCASAGNCAATGFYQNRFDRQQGFAVSERDGVWGKAIEIPGLGHLNSGGTADVSTVSCASPGNCAAGGTYARQDVEGFVVSERDGVWGKAIAVRGLEALNTDGVAEVNSVSCGAPGSCVAVGDYSDRLQGFKVTERDGVWGRATQIPGLAALNTDKQTIVSTVSCVSPGNCAAGGEYSAPTRFPGEPAFHAFVVSERHGVWVKAIQVPGIAALHMNNGGNPEILTLSCATASYCAAGGIYEDHSANLYGFVVSKQYHP